MKHRISRIYDSVEILYVLKKRVKLFASTLIIGAIIALIWAHWQIKSINAVIAESNAKNEQILREIPQYACLRINKYHHINIPHHITTQILKTQESLSGFNKIYDSAFFDITFDTTKQSRSNFNRVFYNSFFEIWVLEFEKTPTSDDFEAITSAVNDNAFAKTLQNEAALMTWDNNPFLNRIRENGFASVADSSVCDEFMEAKRALNPTNKHFINLGKDRVASEKGYSITSTQIIHAHKSLNSNKIYVFALLCAIMISLFITFSAESLSVIWREVRKKSHK